MLIKKYEHYDLLNIVNIVFSVFNMSSAYDDTTAQFALCHIFCVFSMQTRRCLKSKKPHEHCKQVPITCLHYLSLETFLKLHMYSFGILSTNISTTCLQISDIYLLCSLVLMQITRTCINYLPHLTTH